MKLSVCIIAVNEEKNLARCLSAIKGVASEIVVGIDSQTTDKSAAVARKFTKNVFILPHQDNFHLMKKKVIAKCTGDWILQLDADEVVSPPLRDEIKKTINQNPSENGFWLPRANYFLGKFLRKGGAYPDYTLRLYRQGKGNLPGKSVHEQTVVEGSVGYLKNDLLHYNNPTFGVYIERRFQRYTDLMAHHVKGGLFRNLIWEPLFNPEQGFLPIYVRHLGFLDGFPGFIWALFSALHFPIAYFKSIDIREGRAR